MSGNIHDTNVTKLKNEVNNLLTELDEIITKRDNIVYYEDTLKRKYKYVLETSDNLWKLIISQYTNSTFNSFFQGEVSEILVLNSALSTDNRYKVEKYLYKE